MDDIQWVCHVMRVEDEGSQKEFLNGKFHKTRSLYKTSGITKNKMGGLCPEGLITDPRVMRMEEMSRRQRRMEAISERGQGPEGVVAT